MKTVVRSICGAHPSTVGRCTAFFLALAAGIMASGSRAEAQAPPPNTAETYTVDVNYVYAANLGFGGYSIGGLNASVYTLPLETGFDDVFGKGWRLRLLLPIQGGLYHFKGTLGDETVTLDQQSVAAMPGAELDIPVTSNFVVKPFAQGGMVHVFGADGANPNDWIYMAGARSGAEWQAGAYTLSLGNGVVFAGDQTMGPGVSDNYVSLQLGGEVRRPLGFTIGNWTPDLGVYAVNYYYPEPLDFSRFLRPDLKVHNQDEIGITLGSAKPLSLFWLSNPRIGLSYVFGDGLSVWNVNFGFPF